MKIKTHKIIIIVLLLCMYATSSYACRYTIREIGFSTLSRVTYVLYRVDANSSIFPKQQALGFSDSNITPLALQLTTDSKNPIVRFVKANNLKLPAYVLMDQNNRMLSLPTDNYENGIEKNSLFSPIQNRMVSELPNIYATVILVEGRNSEENKNAISSVSKACERLVNVIPNMPKMVEEGPNMAVITKDNFEEEKTLLWSLGIEEIPLNPIAFIVYGRGRIMGEKIDYKDMKSDTVFKLLSIIGADCECGLDRKWMLGYQVPLNWPKKVGQLLNDKLGFDVDNPMILAEMSRILAIENNVPKDPNNVNFEPLVLDLDKEFYEIPEIQHTTIKKEEEQAFSSNKSILYALVFLVIIVIIGLFIVLRKRP